MSFINGLKPDRRALNVLLDTVADKIAHARTLINIELRKFSNVSEAVEKEECEGLFGDPTDEESFAYMMQFAFNVIKYAGPLLCLILSVSDFVKAAASQDKDAIVKAAKTTGKRVVYALVLFFIPTLINFAFELLGWVGTCGIS